MPTIFFDEKLDMDIEALKAELIEQDIDARVFSIQSQACLGFSLAGKTRWRTASLIGR
jgi:hypothetical protein